MVRFQLRTCAFLSLIAITGCQPGPTRTPYDNDADGPRMKDPVDDVKASFQAQYNLVKSGQVENLKKFFTDRQEERLTQAVVEQGRAAIGETALEDLLGSVQMIESQGEKTAKIRMRNGRTLTTLRLIDGEWLSETIWFR